MKASEIREFSLEEKQRNLDDLKEELFNLNFQQETGQLENPQKM
ncbi:MAG: 50S ribosomal protein L29, partial [Desulfobacterales bacterium]|nr:50S ribosomal protein L29 [Desulfobacterales bacterium]MCD4787454.1 50S ribosomal protein L29 [Desulfobacterales bacterium]